ncbi:MAG: hypothetical protein HY860_05685 [Chlamydiales bacterium]|nr:hypothetical protein [Chlamydiales bacterium]
MVYAISGIFTLSCGALCYDFFKKEKIIAVLLSDVEELLSKSVQVAEENEYKTGYKELFFDADPHFLHQQLESLSFLKGEVEFLKTIVNMPGFSRFGPIKKRMEYLTSRNNQILLEEVSRKSKFGFLEMEYKMHHPIDVDEEDIEKILSTLEDVEIKNNQAPMQRPQLFIKEFSITRNINPNRNETFLLDMKIFQREFTK